MISVFSDVYDDIPVDNWNPDWGQSTEVSDFVLERVGPDHYEPPVDAVELRPRESLFPV